MNGRGPDSEVTATSTLVDSSMPYKESPRFEGLHASDETASRIARRLSKKKDTKPEVVLRTRLWHEGCRYRKNVSWLPGKPDIVFLRAKVAIFCDGDFWHGKDWPARREKLLKGHNAGYWISKVEGNRRRDGQVNAQLTADGWTVVRVWESDIHTDLDNIIETVLPIVRGIEG